MWVSLTSLACAGDNTVSEPNAVWADDEEHVGILVRHTEYTVVAVVDGASLEPVLSSTAVGRHFELHWNGEDDLLVLGSDDAVHVSLEDGAVTPAELPACRVRGTRSAEISSVGVLVQFVGDELAFSDAAGACGDPPY